MMMYVKLQRNYVENFEAHLSIHLTGI